METSQLESHKDDQVKELLEGRLSPEAFLDALHRLDQSTPDRINAIENIKSLTQPEVRAFFETQPEHQFNYRNLLSLSYFHQGQIQAGNLEYAEALASFREALAHATLAEAQDVAGYGSWRLYVEATVAYFEKDLEKLKNIYKEMDDEDLNKEIVGNFIYSLENYGEVNYRLAFGQ